MHLLSESIVGFETSKTRTKIYLQSQCAIARDVNAWCDVVSVLACYPFCQTTSRGSGHARFEQCKSKSFLTSSCGDCIYRFASPEQFACCRPMARRRARRSSSSSSNQSSRSRSGRGGKSSNRSSGGDGRRSSEGSDSGSGSGSASGSDSHSSSDSVSSSDSSGSGSNSSGSNSSNGSTSSSSAADSPVGQMPGGASDAGFGFAGGQPPADAPLVRISRATLQRLPDAAKVRFKRNVHRLSCVSGGILTVSTACSGSDLWVAVMLAWLALCAPSLKLSHLWSAENDPSKYEFILKVWKQQVVFRDVSQLASRVARTWDGRLACVAQSLVFAAGFSCKSISALNVSRSVFADCCKSLSGKGSTGATYLSILQHVFVHLPMLVFLENVSTIQRQASAIKEHFRQCGYLMVSVKIDAKHHGFPQSRRRCWFLAVLSPGATDAQLRLAQKMAQALEKQLRVRPLPLATFVADSESARLRAEALQQLGARSRRDLPTKRRWARQQRRAFRRAGITGFEQRVLDAQAQFQLNDREAGILQYHVSTVGDESESVDVSQSLARHSHSKCPGLVGCVTPGHQQFLIREWKPLCGFESLALNGLHHCYYEQFAIQGLFSDSLLKDLGGNAFNGGAAQTALTIAVALFDLPSDATELAELRLRARRN